MIINIIININIDNKPTTSMPRGIRTLLRPLLLTTAKQKTEQLCRFRVVLSTPRA